MSDVNQLDYFLSAKHDAASIRWTRDVNTRDALLQAVTSETMMMIADVNADGFVPVMSGTPLVKSAMTLDAWLDIARHRKKGFRLNFHGIEAAEYSLRKLRLLRHSLRMPVQLSATVVGDPESSHPSPLINPDQFLRLCTAQFPQSTLALSWSNEPLRQRYNWTDVKIMYDLIDRWQIKQPITLVGTARVARASVPQLKWLMEMTGAFLTLSADKDGASLNDLLYIRQRFPIHSVYYDIPLDLRESFEPRRDEESPSVKTDTVRSFVADHWKVVKSREGETIYLGTESVLLQTGLLLTKEEYLGVTAAKPLIIEGRVEFLDDTKSVVEEEEEEDPDKRFDRDSVGLGVFLHATQSSRPDSITGIRCFMGLTGTLLIETRGVPGADAQSKAVIPGTAPCFVFRIIDSGEKEIALNVTRPKTCDDMTVADYSSVLTLPMAGVNTEAGFIAIRQSPLVGQRQRTYTAVDQFRVIRPEH